MKNHFYVVLLVVLAGLLLSCKKSSTDSSESEQANARRALDKLAVDSAQKGATEAEPLVNAGHELWRSGRHEEAIDKYSEVIRVDSSNPYGHFGLGMQVADDPNLLPAANASLRFYLESDADRGATHYEVERRQLAETTFKVVNEKFLKSHEEVASSPKSHLWKTYIINRSGYQIDLPSDAVFEDHGRGDVSFTIGELVVDIEVFPGVGDDGYHSLTNDQLHRRFGPTKPAGNPRKVKVGALDGLRSSGEFPGRMWGTVLTAMVPPPAHPSFDEGPMSADCGYAVRARVPFEHRASLESMIDRVMSSFLVTNPLTAARYYHDVLGTR